MQPDFLIENNYQNLLIAGCDEAGRGPLAGPVVAACVILNRDIFDQEIGLPPNPTFDSNCSVGSILEAQCMFKYTSLLRFDPPSNSSPKAGLERDLFFNKINDSKKLSKTKRQEIFLQLKEKSQFGIGIVDEKTIDEINILQASKLAMFHAFLDLQKKYKIHPQIILVDGNFFPFAKQDKIKEIIPIVKGDQKSLSIAAASIIAKETRDEIMLGIHKKYPQFGFEKHMGYPTKFHIEKINEFGICEIHRRSFQPIKSMICENN